MFSQGTEEVEKALTIYSEIAKGKFRKIYILMSGGVYIDVNGVLVA